MNTPEEHEVLKKMEFYQEAASASHSADKAALAIAAMDEAMQADRVATRKRRWAYIIALSIPPIGIVIAIFYYLSHKVDGKRVGYITLILSVAGFALLWLSLLMFKAVIPANMQSQLNGVDMKELQGFLKEYQ